ncbi:hypothetical protein [Mumia zhuanghuii]|uniref:Uncharacterized protein n=1 Tax=Mumia zhuanghuii TaxID=2585211 RepID=A0A5C4MAF7_9ACTN|nr:hypothetical protein [Mumia zhuanghuii]TNC31281.1 hypothetical protein FHE65_31910 [Mumia zhuanghuii]
MDKCAQFLPLFQSDLLRRDQALPLQERLPCDQLLLEQLVYERAPACPYRYVELWDRRLSPLMEAALVRDDDLPQPQGLDRCRELLALQQQHEGPGVRRSLESCYFAMEFLAFGHDQPQLRPRLREHWRPMLGRQQHPL